MTDPQVLELTGLCNALADGRLTADQRTRLNAWLRDSEEARRFYVRFAGLGASLCDYSAEMQSEAREPAPPKRKLIRHPLAWWVGIGAAAACAIGSLLLTQRDQSTEPGSVAWLTGATDARWAPLPADPPQTGDAIARGQRLTLTSGVAEVTFDSGARLVLEGPATLDVESAWSAALRSGAATASVPAEAAGFRVNNPAVAVTHLGGDARIESDGAEGAEVVSLNGTVEAASSSRATKLVLKGQEARRFSREGVMPVANLDQKLARLSARKKLERAGRPLRYTRWSADRPDKRNAFQDAKVRLTPRTVAFWVRIPSDAAPGDGAEIASFGHKRFGPVRLAWNTSPEQGPLGALRTDAAGRSLIGRSSLRDGRWHHVAVMRVPGRKPGQSELKQYVDGRLEGSAHFRSGQEDLGVGSGEVVWKPRSNKTKSDFKSVVFADRPLTPFELRTLMESDDLPGEV